MKKFLIILICGLFFTGCLSNADNRVQSQMSGIDGVSNMMYDTNTEIVAIHIGAYKAVNAYYHGHPLYYCPHEEKFYYYDNNEDIVYITVKDLDHTFKKEA